MLTRLAVITSQYTYIKSLYCIPETNIMLYINYSQFKKKKYGIEALRPNCFFGFSLLFCDTPVHEGKTFPFLTWQL